MRQGRGSGREEGVAGERKWRMGEGQWQRQPGMAYHGEGLREQVGHTICQEGYMGWWAGT